MGEQSQGGRFIIAFRDGLIYYYLTTLVVMCGVVFGFAFARNPVARSTRPNRTLLDAFTHVDGDRYLSIVDNGYFYDPAARSNVAFFPVYPLVTRVVVAATGMETRVALLLVAHLSLAAAFVLMALYIQTRFPMEETPLSGFALVALGIFPTAFFFRLAYTESLFLLLTLLAFYGMVRRWPLLVIALIIGVASGTRVVGIGLLLPFAWHLWERSETKSAFAWRCLLFPIACSGLLAYMGYLHFAVHNALAFAQTQRHFWARPPSDWGNKTVALLRFEPVWTNFDPASPAFWTRRYRAANPLFSLDVLNPVLFVSAVGLILYGLYKRWLNTCEIALAIGLLVIPYVASSYEAYMVSMGRFVSVVFPIYLVLGHALSRLPGPAAAALCSVSAFFVGAYAAMFAGWFQIY